MIAEPVTNPGEKNLWIGFLNHLKKSFYEKLTNCPHFIFENKRHRIFQGVYFYYVELKNVEDLNRLKKAVAEFADVYSLEEHHSRMLDIYTQKTQKFF